MGRELPIGGVFNVYYFDARTGRRMPDCDSPVGPAYLRRCASDGGTAGEIACAIRQDADGGSWYLMPGEHSWVDGWPEGLQSSSPRVAQVGPPHIAHPTRAGQGRPIDPDWWRRPSTMVR